MNINVSSNFRVDMIIVIKLQAHHTMGVKNKQDFQSGDTKSRRRNQHQKSGRKLRLCISKDIQKKSYTLNFRGKIMCFS